MNKEIRQPSRFQELSLLKRLGILTTLGFSTIASACGNDPTGGEPTTLPPTTIDITTTLPPTTEPSTTTIPTTSTTVAETTATLPLDCLQATGQARIGKKNIDLGLYREGYPFAPFQEGITGRLINIYEKEYEDFQGKKANVLYAEICVGELLDGSRLVAPIMFGRPGIDTILTIFYSSSDLSIANQSGDSFYPISELKIELEKRLENNSQIGLLIITRRPTSASTTWETVQECVDDPSNTELGTGILPYCELGFEMREHFLTNSKFVDFLKSDQLEPSNNPLDGDVLAADGVFLFISEIPSSTS